MRKNKMMRLASALLVLTMLTTSVISGTFAKYVSTAEGSDTARVAKWGVEVAVEGSELFLNEYDNVNDAGLSVAADDLVAPGTKNDTGIKFTLKGTPEVAVNVDIAVDEVKDVFLKAGDYADLTTGNDKTDYFNVAAPGYYPVVFTLKNGAGTELASGKMSDIEAYLESLSGDYPANADLSTALDSALSTDGEYVLTWAWDFDDSGAGTYDKHDTLLGSLAVDSAMKVKYVNPKFYPVAADYDYCNNIGFKVSITVTQID